MEEGLSGVQLLYKGEKQPAPGERDKESGQFLYPYLPDAALVEAVNFAIKLRRPLLLRGEPGTGKTRLARAVAYELGLPYFAWHIKSTSRASDGLYTYDNVARLRDAQLAGAEYISEEELAKIRERVFNPARYIDWGILGKAFQSKEGSVVLIDEIDKADIDFPNDLLMELDEKKFEVKETKETITAEEGKEPILFITSNDEKELPEAFLRRCLFCYIEFPKEEKRLVEIVKARFQDASEELVNKAVKRFRELRKEMDDAKGNTGKKVTTSELIDWFTILNDYPTEKALLEVKKMPASLLLKTWGDYLRFGDKLNASK